MDWLHNRLGRLVKLFIEDEPWKSVHYFYSDDVTLRRGVQFPADKRIRVTFEVVPDKDRDRVSLAI